MANGSHGRLPQEFYGIREIFLFKPESDVHQDFSLEFGDF
jgi:hypothetical protein